MELGRYYSVLIGCIATNPFDPTETDVQLKRVLHHSACEGRLSGCFRLTFTVQKIQYEVVYIASRASKSATVISFARSNLAQERAIERLINDNHYTIQNSQNGNPDIPFKKISDRSQSESPYIDLRGANVGNFAGTVQQGGKQQAVQKNYAPEQQKPFAEVAKEIQTLLKNLSKEYETKTTAEKMIVATKAVEEIEKNPDLKAQLISSLKAGGVEVFKELIDNPIINVILAAFEGWKNPD